jgi:hypothetical protein
MHITQWATNILHYSMKGNLFVVHYVAGRSIFLCLSVVIVIRYYHVEY